MVFGTRSQGRLTLDAASGSATEADQIQWRLLTEFRSDHPIPLELDLSVASNLLGHQEARSWPGDTLARDFHAGTFQGYDKANTRIQRGPYGIARLTFDQIGRYLITDLRNGRFALGNHATCRVEVGLWGWIAGHYYTEGEYPSGTENVEPAGSEITVSAVVRGTIGDADYLRCSAPRLLRGGTEAHLAIPPGAQFFDLQTGAVAFEGSGSPGVETGADADLPQPSLVIDCNARRQVRYQTASGIYYPQGPIPIWRTRDCQSVAVRNLGPVGSYLDLLVTYYVR